MRHAKIALSIFCVALAAPLLGDAQPTGLKRTILQKADLSAPGREIVIHDAKVGDEGGKVLANYIVEKGKPLATPAP